MRVPVISEIGHLALRVRDLEAAAELATNVMGLMVTARTDDAVWLSHGTSHHSLQYIRDDADGVDHVGLVAPDAEAVEDARGRVEGAGLRILSDGPLGPGVKDGFSFEDGGGFVFEIYSEMETTDVRPTAATVRPRRFGHVNFFASEPKRMQAMLMEVLDFRISDWAGEEGAFLRCNVDHHGIGVFPGAGKLHHHAWEFATVVELGAIADFIDARGGSTVWGPMRHGIGRNIATYVREASGMLVEFYCDMDRIYDDVHHVPGHWNVGEGHKWISLWAPHLAPDGFVDMGLPPATRR
jgi:catechol 2,3-dioxygenase